MVVLALAENAAFLPFSLFLLLFIGPTALLVLFMGLTVLFQLAFNFIYNTYSKKISVSANI